MDFIYKDSYSITDLCKIMELLRGENGCPWDKEQTHGSIRKNLIEETYEVCEAIDLEDTALLKEELGDLTLQVIFHSQMEQEKGTFDFNDVCDGICKKLIERHPHIFSDVKVKDAQQVLDNWEQIKQKSKGQTTTSQTLDSVPKVLPALMRSAKVQKRAAKSGFDYPDIDWAMRDLRSEVEELVQAIEKQDAANCEEELGDVLFSAVNVSRFLHIDAEESLTAACEKFIARFKQVEQLAFQEGIEMKHASMEQLDGLWKRAKKHGVL